MKIAKILRKITTSQYKPIGNEPKTREKWIQRAYICTKIDSFHPQMQVNTPKMPINYLISA